MKGTKMVKEENAIENEKVTEPAGESSEETGKAESEVALSNVPLGAIMDKRTQELRNAVFTMMSNYGIPASLMDYILSAILADIRDLKSKEYTDCITKGA